VVGLLILALPYVWSGSGCSPLPAPWSDLLKSVGIALFLSGTVSFGVQELVRAKTAAEFENRLRQLLETTSHGLNAGLRQFLECYVADLGKRIEGLSIETHGSKIKAIFSSREKGLAAMAHAIIDAERFVYVMGISLRQFFIIDGECSRAIAATYTSKNIDFKILVLNNRSAEALDRSSREEGIPFKSTDDPIYRSKTLCRETEDTIATLRRYYPKMNLQVYDSQSLFLLITDKVVFMEPYHYGDRIVESSMPHLKRIAELVPLIEFEKAAEKGPYEQFLGHFRYIFEKSAGPPHVGWGEETTVKS
jgi:hypothetical protein